jgi:predicted transcriptional regulator
MENREMIKIELSELLEIYYNGSFAQLVCDYIRSTGMTRQEVEQLLEEMRKAKGGVSK